MEDGHTLNYTGQLLALLPAALGYLPVGSVVIASVGCAPECQRTPETHRTVLCEVGEASDGSPSQAFALLADMMLSTLGRPHRNVAIHCTDPFEDPATSKGRQEFIALAAGMANFIEPPLTVSYDTMTFRGHDVDEWWPVPALITPPGLTFAHGQQEFRDRLAHRPVKADSALFASAMEVVDRLNGPDGERYLVELMTDPRGLDDAAKVALDRWCQTSARSQRMAGLLYTNGASLDSVIDLCSSTENPQVLLTMAALAAAHDYQHIAQALAQDRDENLDLGAIRKMADAICQYAKDPSYTLYPTS